MQKYLICIFCIFIMFSGCTKKQLIKHDIDKQQVTNETDEEPSVRSGNWQSVAQLKNIYFEYDKVDLKQEARDVLKKNAEYLKTAKNIEVIIEGHCDERGTMAYNLALGQRRAMIVRDYYNKLGMPLKKIATISYGEEKPLDPGHSEASWAKNRRAESKVRAISK